MQKKKACNMAVGKKIMHRSRFSLHLEKAKQNYQVPFSISKVLCPMLVLKTVAQYYSVLLYATRKKFLSKKKKKQTHLL